jgi:hypothetical protein
MAMVATLVRQLRSMGKNGDVVIKHHGDIPWEIWVYTNHTGIIRKNEK